MGVGSGGGIGAVGRGQVYHMVAGSGRGEGLIGLRRGGRKGWVGRWGVGSCLDGFAFIVLQEIVVPEGASLRAWKVGLRSNRKDRYLGINLESKYYLLAQSCLLA